MLKEDHLKKVILKNDTGIGIEDKSGEDLNKLVQEFNERNIKEKIKRTNNLNNIIDILIKDYEHLLNNMNPDDENSIKRLSDISSNINLFESTYNSNVSYINKMNSFCNDYLEVQERHQKHHNIYTSDEKFLESQFKAIDYYFNNHQD